MDGHLPTEEPPDPRFHGTDGGRLVVVGIEGGGGELGAVDLLGHLLHQRWRGVSCMIRHGSFLKREMEERARARARVGVSVLSCPSASVGGLHKERWVGREGGSACPER